MQRGRKKSEPATVYDEKSSTACGPLTNKRPPHPRSRCAGQCRDRENPPVRSKKRSVHEIEQPTAQTSGREDENTNRPRAESEKTASGENVSSSVRYFIRVSEFAWLMHNDSGPKEKPACGVTGASCDVSSSLSDHFGMEIQR